MTITSAKGHRPEIDGLRAVAVVSVLLFHAQFQITSGGFIGVDVFFVLSGFLIAKQLIGGNLVDQVDLIGFYERRFRRIFPAIVPCLAFTWVGAVLFFNQIQFVDFVKSLAASSLFAGNLYFWSSTGYFEGPSELKPLLHMWSLGVEVQFYIGYSLFVAMMVWLRRPQLIATAIVAAISLVTAIWLLNHGSREAAFYLPYPRFWELLAGSILALIPESKPRQTAVDLMELIGAALVIIPVFTYGHGTLFPALAAIPPVLGTTLIVAANSRG